jgi:Fur family ferric uptake transcriptional regulator
VLGPVVTGLGIATVIAPSTLLESGWRRVELPGEAPRYERAGSAHHHHFRCRQCARVFEIAGCPGDFAALAPAGFQLEAHEIVLYGRCAGCAAAA